MLLVGVSEIIVGLLSLLGLDSAHGSHSYVCEHHHESTFFSGFYDIALRDFWVFLSALSLPRLSKGYDFRAQL